MTESNNTPFSGTMVKARRLPDLFFPRWQKWYNTKTWCSSATASYQGHAVSGGRNFQPTLFAQRLWDDVTPPARVATSFSSQTGAMDLTTPFYMLADSTAAGEDTIIGPDYCNLPIEMNRDLEALNRYSQLDTQEGSSSTAGLYVRTLAIKHKFTFVNHSRFPLEIFYTVKQIGNLFNVLATDGNSIHDDMTMFTHRKFVVPAIQDASDRGTKKTLDLAINMKTMFPDSYLVPPGTSMTDATGNPPISSRSPWILTKPGDGSQAVLTNKPPGQFATNHLGVPTAGDLPRAGLRMQWWAKLQEPRDVGITTEGSSTEGDYVGNNYDVHANCSWLMDMMRTNILDRRHTGEKAYPDQTA